MGGTHGREYRDADGIHPRYRGRLRPEIQETIPGGRTQIRGQFDADSARRLAETINRGASPLSLSFESSTDEIVSATTFSEMLRIVEIVAGVGLATIVLGAVVYLRRRW